MYAEANFPGSFILWSADLPLYYHAVNDRGIIYDYMKYAVFITMHSIINLPCHRMQSLIANRQKEIYTFA